MLGTRRRDLTHTGRIWRAAASVAAPLVRIALRHRARRGKEILARLPEREGVDKTPRPPGRLLWLHAASLGESQTILPLLRSLVLTPDLTLLITTGTVTSAKFLAQRLPEFGVGRVLHRFVPLDVPRWVARFLDHWRPDAAAFVESELWPNLLTGCRQRGIPLMLVNGRMSASSARGWGRVPGLAAELLGAFTRVHARSEEDGARLRGLGAPRPALLGDLKMAAPPLPVDKAELARLQAIINDRPIWLAASTHPGEEAVAADVHRRLIATHAGLLTVLVPRHPERGSALAAEFAAARRGAGEGPPAAGLWVVDTIGELGLFYRLAPVVFVGRSLIPDGGGQNPLEPARLGCVLAVGPYTSNFAKAVARLREAGALTVVTDAASLSAWVRSMLNDPARRREAGTSASAAAAGEAGLPDRIADALVALTERR